MKKSGFLFFGFLIFTLIFFVLSYTGLPAGQGTSVNSLVTIVSGPNNTGSINNLDVGSSSLFSLDSRGRYSTSLSKGNYCICVFAGMSVVHGDTVIFIDGTSAYTIQINNGNTCSCIGAKNK